MLRIVSKRPDTSRLPIEPLGGRMSISYRTAGQLGIVSELEPVIATLIARVEKDRDAIEDYILIGRLLRIRGEARRALRLHRNLTVRPNLTGAQKIFLFTEIGLDVAACRVKDRGESWFLKALALSKSHVPALEGLARTYEQLGSHDKAVEILARLIRLGRPERSHQAHVLCELALAHLGRGTAGRARRAVERAIRSDPNCAYAYVVLSDVFIAARRYDRAIAALRSFLERWPGLSFLALRRLEDVHYRMNNFPGYEDTLRSMIRTSPDNFYIYFSLARHLRKKHRDREALEFLKRSLEINPLYVNSLRDSIQLLAGEKSGDLTEQTESFFEAFKRSRRFVCPKCLERYIPVTWNCSKCGHWGSFDIRYELPAP
ncbi:MAG: tetratricopeptide repeat protein [Pseudomonadota bacterium]